MSPAFEGRSTPYRIGIFDSIRIAFWGLRAIPVGTYWGLRTLERYGCVVMGVSVDVSPGLPLLRLRVDNAAAAVRRAQEHANEALTRSREALAWLDAIALAKLQMFHRSPARRKRYRRSPHEVASGLTSPIPTASTGTDPLPSRTMSAAPTARIRLHGRGCGARPSRSTR